MKATAKGDREGDGGDGGDEGGAVVRLPQHVSDDAAFVEIAERAISGAAALATARTLHVVKIDTWFGDRWFRFGGRLWLVGVRPADLTVPPFHPHRVIAESRFCLTDPPEALVVPAPLHGLRTSEYNLRNKLALHGDATTFAWYSGGTATNGRGAVMVYSTTSAGHDAWYAGLVREDETETWRLAKLIGADERQWEKMLASTPT